jgi:hypothetical protein
MPENHFIRLAIFIVSYGMGHFLLWVIGWTLPPPASLSERVGRVFWKYPRSIEAWRIKRFHLAQFTIGILAFLITLTIVPS